MDKNKYMNFKVYDALCVLDYYLTDSGVINEFESWEKREIIDYIQRAKEKMEDKND